VAIDIDENEDAQLVREAWRERGLSEPVAISTSRLTGSLVNQFGPEVVTPPQAPIILISADQTSARLLPSGIKDADDLRNELKKGR